MLDSIKYRIRSVYYDYIRPIFKPQNTKIRNCIPKTWCDITELIVRVNFQFIKSFYEDEYINGVVDWSDTEAHINFSKWLENSYKYVTQERAQLEKERDDAYPAIDFDKLFTKSTDSQGRSVFSLLTDTPYEVRYAEVIRLEKLIEEKDTQVLNDLVKFREYFWT